MKLCTVSTNIVFREAFNDILDMFPYSKHKGSFGSAHILQDVDYPLSMTTDEVLNWVILPK